MKRKLIGGALAALLSASFSAQASLTFTTGVDAGGRQASVNFNVVSATELDITLTSLGTKPAGTWDATYDLTAVFFNLTGAGTLTPQSATGGPSVYNMPSNREIGDYWAYAAGLGNAPGGATRSLQGAGLGVGVSSGNFGSNPMHAEMLDGSGGGIINFDLVGANSSVKDPQVNNSIKFVLFGSNLSEANLSVDSLTFQYGTALTEPELHTAVPEASTYIAGALLLLPFGASVVRRVRKAQIA